MKKIAILLLPCLLLSLAAPAQTRLFKDLRKGHDRTLVVYGTSIARLGNGPLWVERIGEELNAACKGRLTVLNRGGSGRNSQWGADNFADSVLTARPDALIIEFSVNDAVTRFDISPEQSVRNTDYMIRKVREQNPRAEVILLVVSSNPVGEAADKRPDLKSYIAGYHTLAERYGLQVIDFSPVWAELIAREGERGMRVYLHDGVHSTRRGALEMIAPRIVEALETGK
ncbi:SGNH/GDSL hydrolase family protein [Alistipes sp.]|uniref:SGNH/GDSL hydrolase family protein n=1 Tax=Alistipes sp. TaxID=1872444 RepID=UPI003AEF8765